jgi:hypothetical protein
MANIDVQQLMCDPDFVDKVILVTRTPTVNFLGENNFNETNLPTYGSVQPASFRQIQKIPEAMRVVNMSSFWINGTIVATASGQYSSILIFKGVRYQVMQVFDWSQWGLGYTEGICVGERPTL